jgi:hypothetical protein
MSSKIHQDQFRPSCQSRLLRTPICDNCGTDDLKSVSVAGETGTSAVTCFAWEQGTGDLEGGNKEQREDFIAGGSVRASRAARKGAGNLRALTVLPFAIPSRPFHERVHEQFLIPLSTTRLLALSSLHKSYVKAAKHSRTTMLPSHITSLPSGRERGQYLAIGLGETNMRVALVRLQDNNANVDKLERWTIPEPIKTGTADGFFNWLAERIVNLAEQSELDQGEHEWKLGITWSFPFAYCLFVFDIH